MARFTLDKNSFIPTEIKSINQKMKLILMRLPCFVLRPSIFTEHFYYSEISILLLNFNQAINSLYCSLEGALG